LPHRTWGSISTRSIKSFGLSRNLFDWRPEEDKILRDKYARSRLQDLMILLPTRTWSSIQSRASKVLSLSRNVRAWSNEEIGALSQHYPNGGVKSTRDLLPLRSDSVIRCKASGLGIRQIRGENCNLASLFLPHPISYYWLGFLLADGHFDPSRGIGSLCLAKKDENSIREFASFISCQNIKPSQHDSVSVYFHSHKDIPRLCQKFSIQSNKTRYPPDLSAIDNDKNAMLSMLIGLIDGDGCIYNADNIRRSYMGLMCHASWIGIYQRFVKFLLREFKVNGVSPKCSVGLVNKRIGSSIRRYVRFNIFDHYLLKEMKRMAIRMDLPMMRRKWDKVDLEYVTERESTPLVMENVRRLVGQGLKYKEIMKKTGYTESRVKWSIKKCLARP